MIADEEDARAERARDPFYRSLLFDGRPLHRIVLHRQAGYYRHDVIRQHRIEDGHGGAAVAMLAAHLVEMTIDRKAWSTSPFLWSLVV